MFRIVVVVVLSLVPAYCLGETLVVNNDINETVRVFLRPESASRFASDLAPKNQPSYFALIGNDPFELIIRGQRKNLYRLGLQPLRQKIANDPGFDLRVYPDTGIVINCEFAEILCIPPSARSA